VRPGQIKAKVLALSGAEDPYATQDERDKFEDEMRAARADWELDVYGGAKHSFSNPGADQSHVPGLAYNREADQRSWSRMKDFLKEIFAGGR
jgi:dienelactone hydrolase